MSTPAPPHSSHSLHPVREQLDELDGLLQRMLELPVEQAPEDSPGLPPSWSEETAVDMNGNPLVLESSKPEQDSLESARPSLADFPFPLASPGAETMASPLLDLPHRQEGGSGAEPADSLPQTQEWEPELSLWYWPLVALNRAADNCLGWGRPGQWLRGTWGRATLGVMGILLLVGALLWGLLDWMQWTW